jgi:hypothetical protein
MDWSRFKFHADDRLRCYQDSDQVHIVSSNNESITGDVVSKIDDMGGAFDQAWTEPHVTNRVLPAKLLLIVALI